MDAKTELRLINEIITISGTTLKTKQEKQLIIIKSVKALRKYGYTNSWWYLQELPLYLKRNDLTNRLSVVKDGATE